jgi:hypothetical protein
VSIDETKNKQEKIKGIRKLGIRTDEGGSVELRMQIHNVF